MNNNQNGQNVSYEIWLAALASSACIGFTSLVPWLFNLTFFERREQQQKTEGHYRGDGRMKMLLSFAVGAILGDIFFHLIPESLQSHLNELGDSPETAHKKVGMSIVAGIFMFIIVEMILEKWSHSKNDDSKRAELSMDGVAESTIYNLKILDEGAQISNKEDLTKLSSESILKLSEAESIDNNNCLLTDLNSLPDVNNYVTKKTRAFNKANIADPKLTQRKKGAEKVKICDNYDDSSQILEKSTKSIESLDSKSAKSGFVKKLSERKNLINECEVIDVAGYLSLIANGFDNFTHGLAIGASFLVGPKVGLLTTFVIFIHEIPHEICDYAILVNSGFSRWDAVKAQSSVSLFGIIGTATALYVKSVQTLNSRTIWILPFSAGGFLYIALVNLLPEILKHKTDFLSSIGQIACVILGAAFMAFIAIL